MQIWPHSATMAETGTPAAGGASPFGGAGGPGGGAGLGMAPAPNAGEILLNRAESAALAALELEDDPEHGLRRAQAESGLDRQQLAKLKRRVEVATSKGYTLKGSNFVKKPLATQPDEPGLTRKAVKGEDVEEKPKAKAEAKAKAKPAAKAKEANIGTALLTRQVTGPDLYTYPDMDYGYPTPQSAGERDGGDDTRETNTMTTLAAMLRMNRKRRAR